MLIFCVEAEVIKISIQIAEMRLRSEKCCFPPKETDAAKSCGRKRCL